MSNTETNVVAVETPVSTFRAIRTILTIDLVREAPESVTFHGYVSVARGHREYFTLDRKELIRKLARIDIIAEAYEWSGQVNAYYISNL